jgi:hypothetical protein
MSPRDRELFAEVSGGRSPATSPGLARHRSALKILIYSAHRVNLNVGVSAIVTTPESALVGASGLLYQRWHESFGRDDDDRLVVLGDTLSFNPGFDRATIDREMARDPARSGAKYSAAGVTTWRPSSTARRLRRAS